MALGHYDREYPITRWVYTECNEEKRSGIINNSIVFRSFTAILNRINGMNAAARTDSIATGFNFGYRKVKKKSFCMCFLKKL
jgi:hypothetical protein